MKEKNTMRPLLKEDEAAKILNISVHTLRYDRSRNGKQRIPVLHIGRSVRYCRAELQKFLNTLNKGA